MIYLLFSDLSTENKDNNSTHFQHPSTPGNKVSDSARSNKISYAADLSSSTGNSNFEGVEKTSKLGFTLPGLVTLTLIKDTVTHFLMSGTLTPHSKGLEQSQSHSDNMGMSSGKSVSKCKCANCPLKKMHTKTQHDKNNSSSSMKRNSADYIRFPASKYRNDKPNGCKGCHSRSGDKKDDVGLSDLDEQSKENLKVTKLKKAVISQACEIGRKHGQVYRNSALKEMPHILPCRIETKFFDLVSRFETSSQIVFAG